MRSRCDPRVSQPLDSTAAHGVEYGKGIIGNVLPVATAERYRVLVPKVDQDGNETSGIRLPDIAVPTAMGWSVRSADAGGAGELCYLDG